MVAHRPWTIHCFKGPWLWSPTERKGAASLHFPHENDGKVLFPTGVFCVILTKVSYLPVGALKFVEKW